MVSWPVPTAGWLAKKTTRLSVLPVPVPLVVRSAALALEPPILNVGDVSILRVRLQEKQTMMVSVKIAKGIDV